MRVPPIWTLFAGVPGVLGELARRGRLDDLAAHAAREPDPLALDVGAGVAEQAERVGVAAELEPDLLEDRVGVLLDDREALLVEDLERLERPGQERHALDVGPEPGGRPAGAAAGSLAGTLVGRSSLLLRRRSHGASRRLPPGLRASARRRAAPSPGASAGR